MRFLHRLGAVTGALRRSKRHRLDMPRWLARRPALLASTAVGELALLAQNRADPRLKTLAGMKAAALVSCEYCLDISAALAKADGFSADTLVERLGKAAYVELAFEIAWEHKRGRFYHAIGLRPTGIAEGLVCPIPEGRPGAGATAS
jgi:AhpD family alkylhydroperoxidase